MSRPDLTRRQFVERFHFTSGNGWDKEFCGLKWQPLPAGWVFVVAYEHLDNTAQNATNAAEFIYKQSVERTR